MPPARHARERHDRDSYRVSIPDNINRRVPVLLQLRGHDHRRPLWRGEDAHPADTPVLPIAAIGVAEVVRLGQGPLVSLLRGLIAHPFAHLAPSSPPSSAGRHASPKAVSMTWLKVRTVSRLRLTTPGSRAQVAM
jgi:hypothetical protein